MVDSLRRPISPISAGALRRASPLAYKRYLAIVLRHCLTKYVTHDEIDEVEHAIEMAADNVYYPQLLLEVLLLLEKYRSWLVPQIQY